MMIDDDSELFRFGTLAGDKHKNYQRVEKGYRFQRVGMEAQDSLRMQGRGNILEVCVHTKAYIELYFTNRPFPCSHALFLIDYHYFNMPFMK
jgi:hypothetical protein